MILFDCPAFRHRQRLRLKFGNRAMAGDVSDTDALSNLPAAVDLLGYPGAHRHVRSAPTEEREESECGGPLVIGRDLRYQVDPPVSGSAQAIHPLDDFEGLLHLEVHLLDRSLRSRHAMSIAAARGE
jgi:hypothetical protein